MTATWLGIVLALLKFANLIVDYASSARDRKAGQDEAIAKEALQVLQKTEYGRTALEAFRANPGSADDFLRSLEPPG